MMVMAMMMMIILVIIIKSLMFINKKKHLKKEKVKSRFQMDSPRFFSFSVDAALKRTFIDLLTQQ